jgi:hypothetical protein
MIDIKNLKNEEFKKLPLVIEGESKEIRYAGSGLVVIRFKPTIYSFTNNRCSEVKGSEIPRLRSSKIFVEVLKKNDIKHAYKEITDKFVLADLVIPHEVEFNKYNLKQFVPDDLSANQMDKLPRAPPIEIIAKRYLTGTTKHGSIGMGGTEVRKSHPFYKNMKIDSNGAFPEIIIRFDWRNPLRERGRGKLIADQILGDITNKEIRMRIEEWGDRVADMPLAPQIADFYIDVKKAQKTAFITAKVLEEFLASKNIVFYDLCLFIAEDGELGYGEISPDCGRFRHLDLGSLDKDVWRTGGSSKDVINKWNLLYKLIAR